MNRDNEVDAQRITEALCLNPALRAIYVSIISEGIIEANRYGRHLWAVNMSEKAIRLTVAHYYACTIDAGGIWLALDNAFLHNNENNAGYLPTMSELNSSGWRMDDSSTAGAYPTFKDRSTRTEFSANGYYSVGKKHSAAWKHISRLYLGFIYKAICYGQDMDKHSPEKHCSGFLKYARNQYGIALPDPLYAVLK